MLSAAEQSLIRRDSELPGLALLLDEEAFLASLRKQIPEAEFLSARRRYIRYKPGMNCLVRYELKSASAQIDVYAKTFGKDAAIKLGKALQRPAVSNLLGNGRILINDHQVQVCTFPNDDKLKVLAKLGDDTQRQQLLQRVMKNLPEFQNASLDTLQYKPERRYVTCLQGDNGQRAAVKFYTDHAFTQARYNAEHVSNLTQSIFPRLISFSKRHRSLAFEWIDGQLLSDCFLLKIFDLTWIKSLSEILSAFHQTTNNNDLLRQDKNVIAIKLTAQARGIGFLIPEEKNRADSLARKLIAALESLPDVHCRIHNDFYAKQVLCTASGIRLVDSDDICIGHPAADLGLFIAHLERNVISGGLQQQRASDIKKTLLEHYKVDDKTAFIRAVSLYTAVGLIQLAHHPYRTCQPEWPGLMTDLLDRAESYFLQYSKTNFLSHSANATPVTDQPLIDDSFDVIKDQSMPFLSSALNPQLAKTALLQLLSGDNRSNDPIRLHKIKVRRHKPGRRCLIEYTVSQKNINNRPNTFKLIGKVRARGLDKKTFRLNQTLFSNGFDHNISDGIQVPEPVGCLPEFQMWLQHEVEGTDLFHLLTGPHGLVYANCVAEAAFKLHSSHVAVSHVAVKKTHSLQDELTILEHQLLKVANSHRHWRKRIQNILAACHALCESAPLNNFTGIHRDFYHDQILIDGDNLYLLDLDLYCLGDPALDIGNFVAHIKEQCLREYDLPNAFDNVTEAFINHYCQLANHNLHDSITMYTTLSLVRHIAISQRIKKRNRFTSSIISLCETKLNINRGYLHAV